MTFDTALTVALVAVVVIAAVRRGRLGARPGQLGLILVGTTLTTYLANLVPHEFRIGLMFYLGLIFPVAYQFFADAKELNKQAVNRAARVLLATGIAALALAVQATTASSGEVFPESGSAADIGLGMLRVPLLLLVLAAAVSAMPHTPATTRRRATR